MRYFLDRNIGQKKYRNFLAANKMAKRIQKMNIPCVEMPLWEIANGPHFDDLQRLFESFWIPDMTSTEHFLLQYDLVVVPDNVMAKYMVEAYYEKESKCKQSGYACDVCLVCLETIDLVILPVDSDPLCR